MEMTIHVLKIGEKKEKISLLSSEAQEKYRCK